jgi:hypothetical protein
MIIGDGFPISSNLSLHLRTRLAAPLGHVQKKQVQECVLRLSPTGYGDVETIFQKFHEMIHIPDPDRQFVHDRLPTTTVVQGAASILKVVLRSQVTWVPNEIFTDTRARGKSK